MSSRSSCKVIAVSRRAISLVVEVMSVRAEIDPIQRPFASSNGVTVVCVTQFDPSRLRSVVSPCQLLPCRSRSRISVAVVLLSLEYSIATGLPISSLRV